MIDAVGSGRSLLAAVLLLVAVLLAAAALGAAQDYLLQRTAEGVVLTTRLTLADRLLRLPVAEYDRRRTGDLMSRVGADTTLLRATVTSGVVEVAGSVVIATGALVAMALVDGWLLLLTVLAVGVGLTAAVLVSRGIRRLSRQAQEEVGAMTAAVERALSAVRTIRASGATGREVAGVGVERPAVVRRGGARRPARGPGVADRLDRGPGRLPRRPRRRRLPGRQRLDQRRRRWSRSSCTCSCWSCRWAG